MDLKLLNWGIRRKHAKLPPLWLFTDEDRLADPIRAVRRLPPGRAGVVLRHDRDPARRQLAWDLARICKTRRLSLVVAADLRLAGALKAGVHLRGGRWPRGGRPSGLVTSSAHSVHQLRRAQGAGANIVFLSPAFATASHPGAPALGPLRWAAIARRGRPDGCVAALGGINGATVKQLPARLCQAIGAIEALA